MDIRESINKHPRITGTVTVVVAAALACFVWYQLDATPGDGRQFYTDDDGKTWFSAPAGKLVPYQRDGKEVVRAEVFEVKGRQFVAYMRRYPADVLSKLTKEQTNPGSVAKSAGDARPPRMEYKKPGDSKWRDIEGDMKAMSDYLNLNSSEGELIQVEP